MTGEDVAVACVMGPVLTGLAVFLVHLLVDGTEDKLWPRGLRWFPGLWLDTGEALHRTALRIFWPERRYAFKGRKVLRLEALDRDWRCWAGSSEGGIPAWDPDAFRGRGAWRPRVRPPQLCPCGYADECVIWCGSSRLNGVCPTHSPEPTVLPRPGVRYER